MQRWNVAAVKLYGGRQVYKKDKSRKSDGMDRA